MCSLKADTKRILMFLVLLLSITLYNNTLVEASSPITVTINEQILTMDVPPIIKEGRTLVPLRAIFEALGAQVSWDAPTGKITGTKGNTLVVLHVGNKSASSNGNQITLDVAPQIINGRTMVPTRFVAESLGAKVEWNAATSTVSVFSDVKRSTRINLNLSKSPLTVKEIVALVQPATVLIQTNRGSGSGFFVTTDGEVLTNAHVVRGSQWVNIKDSNGQTFPAKIIKIDNANDLALVKVSANQNFPIIEYMSYINNVSVGDEIIAFGNPLGLEKTVTRGIVSAKRDQPMLESWTASSKVIQHDATIGPGSSGGAIVNLYGELIGVNSSGYLTKDFSFAISSDYLSWLSQSSNGYNLREDWYSYFTEAWEWHKTNISIINQTEGTRFADMYYVFSQALYRVENLKQEVNSYYPQFFEIIELKRLYLELLIAEGNFFRYMVETSQNPYMYSESQFNYFADPWKQAEKIYYDKYNVLFENFR